MNEIFEDRRMFETEIFEVSSQEQPTKGAGVREWMSAAVVHATVAIATAGTLTLSTPITDSAATAPTAARVQFAYRVAAPQLSSAQKTRAERIRETFPERPHPDGELDIDPDFV